MADEETADDANSEGAEPEGGADEQGNRKTRTGTVVSDKMQKTVVVSVTRKFEHSTYEKYVRDRQKYKAHDENERTKVGDKVLIEETRPISKDKRWRIREIIEEAPTV